MNLDYNIRVSTPAGSVYVSNIDMAQCFEDVGVDSSLISGVGSYTGNINSQKIESDRIAVTGSGGFIGYGKNGEPLVEVKNQVIFDMNPPPNMNSVQQTSVQVFTKNLVTGETHTYKPTEQHYNPEPSGNIEISNLEKKDFIDTSYCNPNLKEDDGPSK